MQPATLDAATGGTICWNEGSPVLQSGSHGYSMLQRAARFAGTCVVICWNPLHDSLRRRTMRGRCCNRQRNLLGPVAATFCAAASATRRTTHALPTTATATTRGTPASSDDLRCECQRWRCGRRRRELQGRLSVLRLQQCGGRRRRAATPVLQAGDGGRRARARECSHPASGWMRRVDVVCALGGGQRGSEIVRLTLRNRTARQVTDLARDGLIDAEHCPKNY